MNDSGIRDRRRYLRSVNKMPAALILAEIFILVLCMSYIMKIGGISLDIVTSEKHSLMDIVLLEMNVIFFGVTVFAALGIYSHKPESWRKVVRSCITFTVTMLISTLYSSNSNAHAFDFNPIVTSISLITLFFMMMCDKKIKEFYTPPMTDVPRMKEWIRFIFYGRLINSTYAIDFGTDSDRPLNPIKNDTNERIEQ